MANKNDGENDSGLVLDEKLVLTLTYDPKTYQVTIGGTQMPMSLAQMILGEAARLLEEQRRVAVMRSLQEQQVHRMMENQFLSGITGKH